MAAYQVVKIVYADRRTAPPRCQMVVQQVAKLQYGQFAHTVYNHIATAVEQNAAAQLVFPIIVVSEAPQRSLDAAQHHRHIGKQLFQDVRIDDGRIFRPHVVPSVGAVSVLGAQAAVSGVFVDHRVHASRRYAEEKPRTPQLLKVAKVAMPVRLRDNGNAIPLSFQQTPDNGGSKRRMIHIGVAAEQDDVGRIPSAQLHFLFRRWQPVCQLQLFHASVAAFCSPSVVAGCVAVQLSYSVMRLRRPQGFIRS